MIDQSVNKINSFFNYHFDKQRSKTNFPKITELNQVLATQNHFDLGTREIIYPKTIPYNIYSE